MPVIVLVSWWSMKVLKKLFLSLRSSQAMLVMIVQELNATVRMLSAAKRKYSPKNSLNNRSHIKEIRQ